MKTVNRRQRIAAWRAEFKRGRWFVVDHRTGRRVKVASAERAQRIASQNNARELDSGE